MRGVYWCKYLDNGEDYHFMSSAILEIGIIIKDEEGRDARIVDMAVESFPLIRRSK